MSADNTQRAYEVYGQVFFASAEQFAEEFDFKEEIDKVTIDLTRAHFWDFSAVGALDKVVLKFRRQGTEVELLGLNEASSMIVERLGVYDKPGALALTAGH